MPLSMSKNLPFSLRTVTRRVYVLSKKCLANIRCTTRNYLSKSVLLVLLSLPQLILTLALFKGGLEDIFKDRIPRSNSNFEPFAQNAVDPCSLATPQVLSQFDPSNRSSSEFAHSLTSDVDPSGLVRVFTAFFKDFLFQPHSDIVVNLTSTGRGRPTDIRNSLKYARSALRTVYGDDSITLQSYTMAYSHLDRVRGSRYIFHLISSGNTHASRRDVAAVQRMFDGKCYVSVRHYPAEVFDDPIYILVPYSQRPARLKWFLSQFDDLRITNVNARLVLAFCREIQEDSRTVYEHVRLMAFSRDVVVVEVPGDRAELFSRAVAIREGSHHIPRDCIMFISDVDMYIYPPFFDSCRLNTIRGNQVYFPVFYSLYARSSRIEKDAGYWRDSSYGMSCMYKSDFDKVDAYRDAESKFRGWGGEDVALSQAFLEHAHYEVFRAVEPSLRHKWHMKRCEPSTSSYEECVSMAFRQLGVMARVGRFMLDKNIDAQSLFAEFAEDDGPVAKSPLEDNGDTSD